MSQFIELSDYDASIHRDILASVTRDDEAIVEICEERAIAEMRGYLCGRYDCDRVFAARAAERHPLVLMMLIDMVVYHLFCIHNPVKMSDTRKDRYQRAVDWMKAIRRGDVSVEDLPLLPGDERNTKSPYQLRSNRKRINHY